MDKKVTISEHCYELQGRVDHTLNDTILCLLIQQPGYIAYYLSKNVIKRMVYWQSILHFSGFLIKFQSFPMIGVLGMFKSRIKMTIFSQIIRDAFWEL